LEETRETRDTREKLPLVNEQIRSDYVYLIGQDGENIGLVSRREAMQRASESALDLVMLAEHGKDEWPVVKIMDFGKLLYEKKKKKNESKKHQKVIQIKEIKISPKIGDHDFQTKMKQMLQFLEEGKRVKITLFFRGRENFIRDERGTELFDKIDTALEVQGLNEKIAYEKDAKLGKLWSRIYYLK
jgi:translation initiation factor IF-3